MRRSVISGSPEKSAAILAVGFVAYAFVCGPAIGRRGYPEMDPFYLAIPWLWAVPVIVSAPFSRICWGRVRDLLIYSLAAAVVLEGCFNPWAIPRQVDLMWMLVIGPIHWGPLVLGGTVVAEAIAQFILRYIRAIVGDSDGVRTPAGLVQAPWRVRIYCIALLAATLAFPFIYRKVDIAVTRHRGVEAADRAWAEGTARWPIPFRETDPERGTWDGDYDPGTGLEIYAVGEGVIEQTFWQAYRKTIQQQVTQHGPAPMAKCLFRPEELVSLLSNARFERVTTFPFKYGSLTIDADGSLQGPSYTAGGRGGALPFMYRTIVHEKGNVMVLVTEDGFVVIHPDGRVLQPLHHPITEDMIHDRN